MDESGAAAVERPLWRRILDFPLVTLIVAVAVFIGAYAIGIFIGRQLPYPSTTLAGLALRAVIYIGLGVAAYKLIIARLGERPRDELRAKGAAKGLGVGVALGVVLFSVIVGVAALADVYNVIRWGGTEQLLMVLLAAALIPGILEEILFRGILFRWIEAFGGSWAALVVTSILFGLAHILNPAATWFSSFAIAVEAGVLLGGAYMLTRSLWMPIGLHAAWNFTQGFIFDVPVSGLDQQGLVEARLSGPELLSGGAFGLEASVIALVIATAAGLWLVMLAVRRGEQVQPWWVRRREAIEP